MLKVPQVPPVGEQEERARLLWLAVRRALFMLIAGVDAVFGVETKHRSR